MKKSLISGVLTSALLLVGSIFPTVASANTTTLGKINYGTQGAVTTNQVAYLKGLNENILYNITNRALSPNSSWYFDRTISGNDGFTYYRVATNEWVSSNYLTTNTFKTSTTPSTSVDTPTVDTTTSKGWIIGNSLSKIYHVPGQQSYNIKSSHAVYFSSEQDAINAGYQKSKR
ncbi:hypothetical protein LCR01_03100 [Companilactobacillus crustorum]|uniref:Surface layer protein A domain-containing protein n=2 Tax=Companilactobacillus TaxID=2767879 RepID=A0A2P4R953_9LACO|nr:hypothetical protein [Companilactobacillus crustorum]WDT66720.1 hypothetical protein NV391_05820 [Companilactobacillus crustorum]GEO75867.1 hypothetical protein LCR01_03100 [Companilactobacillus crustorum]HCD07125.1 hypothetical protein [Lactobacillus sp.]